VLDTQYASPLTAIVPRNFMMSLGGWGAPVLAELDFVNVMIDARGTMGRSRAFGHYSWLNLNTIGLEDHVAAIKELGERFEWMDVDRVGIHGSSYGGWTAFRGMFEFPDFYDVGIANVPMGALHNMYPDFHWEGYHGSPVYADGSSRRPGPTDTPDNYDNANGNINAANLKGKLLIMMGERDENVLPSTTLQIVDALIEMDADFDLMLYTDRPHNIRVPHQVRTQWNYLVEHLHGVEPPRYKIEPWE
jgi:dipeptidyl aminopeptidase/acylaminoacyl peptidase